MNKLKLIVSAGLILAVVFAAFYPSLENGFVNFDDDIYVILNPTIRNLSPEGIARIFTTLHQGLYKPLVFLTFALEYHFFKLNPGAYHFTNLILHLLNCMLVFLFIFILTGEYPVAFIVALLFGIHPLHVESVAWITERKDLLCSFFFLGAAIFYLFHIKTKAKKFYWLSLFFFALSLLSKPMAISFPVILLIFDYFLDIKYDKSEILKKIPFFVIAGVYILITLATARGFVHNQPNFSFIDDVFIAAFDIVFYLAKLLLPQGLSCFYPYPDKTGGLLPSLYLLSAVILIFLVVIVAVSRRYTKKILFGALFFICSILPVLQLLPSGPAIAGDRYTYLPSLGFFYILGVAITSLYAKKLKTRFLKTLFSAFLILIAALLSFLTWNRCKVWKNGITLWSDALSKYPGSALINNNLGVAYSDRGEYDKAIVYYDRALKIDPYYAESYYNLGAIFFNKKQFNKALAEFNKTLSLDPGFLDAYYNIAMIFGINGYHKQAIEVCKYAIGVKPDYAPGYDMICMSYGSIGDYAQAIKACKKALEIDERFASAHMNLAVSYYYSKQYDLAIRHYDRAIELGYRAIPKFLEKLKAEQKIMSDNPK